MKELLAKMRKYHTGLLILSAVWGFIVYGVLFLLSYEDEVILSKLSILPVVFTPVPMIGAVLLMRWFLAEYKETKRFWILEAVCFLIPAALGVVRFVTMDYLYDFTGVFLGGLDVALGCVALWVLCAVFAILFGICYSVVRKRRMKGIESTGVGRVAEDICNIVPVAAIVVGLAVGGISLCNDMVSDIQYRQKEAQIQSFKTSLYEASGMNEEELVYKAYSVAVFSTVASSEQDALMVSDELSAEEIEILKKGIKSYIGYANQYHIERGLMQTQPEYSGKRQRMICRYIFDIEDDKKHVYRSVYIVVELDEKGALADMFCMDTDEYISRRKEWE